MPMIAVNIVTSADKRGMDGRDLNIWRDDEGRWRAGLLTIASGNRYHCLQVEEPEVVTSVDDLRS